MKYEVMKGGLTLPITICALRDAVELITTTRLQSIRVNDIFAFEQRIAQNSSST